VPTNPRRDDRGPADPAEARVAVFLSRGDDAAVGLAGSCALAGVAMGRRVDVFLLGDGVRAVLDARDEPDAPGHRLHRARAAGACRLFACSESLVGAGLSPQDAEGALDAVVGWPTILEWTRGVADRHSF
jgi:sulfur relay (sulfurtransferase) DsrF/TusC family protein